MKPRYLLLLGLLLLGLADIGRAQFQYRNANLLQIIDEIEQQTEYRFLYRDALVSDISISLSASEEAELFNNFRAALAPFNLTLKVDSSRKQAIIFRRAVTENRDRAISVRGQVVDAKTGERLPFATISWQHNNTVKGVSSNERGSFEFSRSFAKSRVDIKCSYVGYATKTVTLDLSESGRVHELTFRLEPVRVDANELVITGGSYYSNISRQASDLVDIGTFSPLGESNTLRALQTLPAVSLAPAMSDGLHVRGSPTDGFQVLIDDIPIYNQSHLFGLVDSFNSDILKRSGFYYDIAPAQFQAPPGGTLSLRTKTGSLNRISGTAGISNSSGRLSIGGPIQKGSSSWLVSARKSFMDTITWLNNPELIEWGLNVNRDKGVLADDLINFESLLVKTGDTDASFFDLHGKIYFEGNNGDRLIASGYFGGDDTRQQAQRLYRSFSSGGGSNFQRRPVTTQNEWHNGAGSLQYQSWLSENLYSSTTAGLSIYETSFSKDDFTYININRNSGALQTFVFPFENRSILNEIKAEQKLEWDSDPWLLTGGVSYHYYLGEYYEDSFDRPGFFSSQRAHQLDGYAQLDYGGFDQFDIFAGTRLHYYSNGQYLRWSPRLKVTLFPDSKFSISGGFSRNHQFLNKISLSNTVTSDIWIINSDEQPPTSVNYYSGGIYFRGSKHFYLQLEGYLKEFENLRLHEINAFSLSNNFSNRPWFIDNTGTGKGLEIMLRNSLGFLGLSQTLTLSEMKLSNPAINEGEPFYADWDRTYRYTATLQAEPFNHFSLYLSWMYATGTPNKLSTFGPQNDERLGSYRRTDISAEYTHNFGGGYLKASATVFNLFDRQNPWYRELTFVIDRDASSNRFRSVPVDVYDIGFQPSFNISVGF